MFELGDYWVIFATFSALVAAGIGLPIPEELPTIGAGIWVASTPQLGPARWIILPVCYLGVLISDVLLYGIGRAWGPRLLEKPFLTRILPPEKRRQIEHNFLQYGIKILLVVRWLPAIRSPMFITVGVLRVPVLRFILFDGLAAVVGHTLLFFLAYWFGDQFRDLIVEAEEKVNRLRPVLILTLIAGVTLYFLVRFLRRPVMTGDPQELPLIGQQVAAKMAGTEEEEEKEKAEGKEPTGQP